MANIPFKSITFPGLPNKYTVPEISNDLMTAGKAADAKATGDALALKADKSTTYTKTEVDQMISDVEVETDTTLEITGAPADAAETGRQFGLIKADLDATNNDLRKMVGNIPGEWVLGGMYASTGIEYGSTSVIRTPFIQVEPGDTIYFDNPDTSLTVTVLEFANNTPTSAGVNERLAVTGVTSINKRVTLSGTTNYIRMQINTGDTLKGDDVLVYTKHNVVFDSITEASEAIKTEMNGKFASEPIIPIIWEQGRLSTSGTLVASTYAIRSKDFICVDDKRRSISVMFSDYDLPTGSTGLRCVIFEYSSTDPVTFNSYYEYISRYGNFIHTVADDTVAIKVLMYYLAADTYSVTPDKGYLITLLWAKDGISNAVVSAQDWGFGQYKHINWAQGRLTTSGAETSVDPPRIRTGFISVQGIKKLLVNAPENTQFGYFWYDADRAFISSNSYIMAGVKASNRTIVDVPVSAYYLRLIVGKQDNSAISTAYGNDVTIFNFGSCDHGKIENNPPMLSIMDDDGNIKFYTDLYPILADRKVPACSAVVVSQIEVNANRMTWAQIEEMYENGIEIISHTYSHWADTNEYPNNVLTNDYQKSINIIHRHGIDTHDLGVLPQSSGITKRFRDAGKQVYKGIFVNGEATNYKGFDPYSIRRYKVGNNTTTHIELNALKALIDTLTSGWMILSLHTSTGDGWVDGTGEGSSAYIIGQAIDYALSKGIPIVTCECGFKTYSTEWNCTQVPDYE